MKKSALLIGLVFFFSPVIGQELFPMNEPASTVPKGVLGVKVLTESYNEIRRIRNQASLRVQYGLTGKLTVWAQPMISNHHAKSLPADMVNHQHAGPNTVFFSTAIDYGANYPYSFAGLHLYSKYRFLNFDSDDAHFRMAFYGEYTAFGTQAHDEAEGHLQGDTGGAGAGLIATWLKNRWAVSFTGGAIVSNPYTETLPRNFRLEYSPGFTYNLSIGYLAYPKKYQSYQQSNYNLYLELMGKSFDAASFSRLDNERIEIDSYALQSGSYLDIYIGVQRIIRSNDRLELSIGFPFINKSYRHFYPVLNLGWQRYFFFGKK
ncbi:MAG: hypothetical protein HKN16_09590 [Saprospiraceae bacterium]|nr:hypothetical protein [Saprospiraceae bacterium]